MISQVERAVPLQLNRPSKPVTIGLTPLIDVVFILLLFFMLATNFQRWRSVDIDAVRTSNSSETSTSKTFLVRVSETEIDVSGESVSLAVLGSVLKARLDRSPGAQVMVSALDDAPVQRIVSVMDVLRDNGIRQAQLSVQ